MNEQEALTRMVAPGTRRPGKYREGVIQIHVTRACDKACIGCTQGSNLRGKPHFISIDNFERAIKSLDGYFGVYGVFGGNPALHPQFEHLCELLRRHVPFNQRGLWCNHPLTPAKARAMRETFDPSVSNLNVHLDQEAYDLFKTYWPECSPVGLHRDSRHSPPWVALKDVEPDEAERWRLISDCDINKHWSAMMGEFRGELRAWFCEIAGAQAIRYQDDPTYPDTGLDPVRFYEHETAPGRRRERTTVGRWWQLGMNAFNHQVRKHCHECGIPLRGYGALAMDEGGVENVSETHRETFQPKRVGRRVSLVTTRLELLEGRLERMTDYLGNAKR